MPRIAKHVPTPFTNPEEAKSHYEAIANALGLGHSIVITPEGNLDAYIDGSAVYITIAAPEPKEPEAISAAREMIHAVNNYVIHRTRPGSAMSGLLQKDLGKFMGYADAKSIAGLKLAYLWVYNRIPRAAWGSEEKYTDWTCGIAEDQAEIIENFKQRLSEIDIEDWLRMNADL